MIWLKWNGRNILNESEKNKSAVELVIRIFENQMI